VGVRCAFSANRIIEPIFYEGTLDAQLYINEMLYQFFFNLAPAEERFGYFIHTQLRKLSDHYAVCLGN
jgi:hypothetical protein